MGPQHLSLNGKVSSKPLGLYDRWLLLSVVCLVVIGLLMVTSSSIVISEKYFNYPLHYLFRQSIYLFLGIVCALFILRIEIQYWLKASGFLLLYVFFLLALVLIPGIGRSVNGSYRWIGLGPVRFQVSELAKLVMVIYMAGFLSRKHIEVRTKLSGFIKPLFILALITLLLLKEPDFGAAVVITLTVLGMMFLAGVRLWQFIALFVLAFSAIVTLAISSPYRLARLTSFLKPWENQFDGGYQLTQSLIAFGRGGVTGVGLGESIQKLFYLPEAHTDFLLAVLAEELGLLGVCGVIALYGVLCWRGLSIARLAEYQKQFFSAFLAYGLTLWLIIQAMINIGVNIGLLPTKGLTLPLMSFGGSSMLVSFVAIALLLRIDHESRWHVYER
jgi:cell division protein FtsW